MKQLNVVATELIKESKAVVDTAKVLTEKYSCIPETLEHIENVRNAIEKIRKELIIRGLEHDAAKMEESEVSYFDKYTPLLKTMEYGSPEYTDSLEKLKPALEHHYATYRHHPEFYADGVKDMNLVDIMEMFCDWYAASMRTKNGNMQNSIDISCKRFNICPDLKQIFINSVELLTKKY